MGKKLGTVALFLGAFVLALAVLSKFYMYDRLAVVPLNQDAVSEATTAPGADAEYLDVAAGLKVTNGPLKNVKVVRGDVEASKKASKALDRDIAVWDIYDFTDTPSFDAKSGESPLTGTDDRVAFDRNTGEAVKYEDTKSEGDGKVVKPADVKGLYFKFPFDAQKKTYQFWDGTLRKATPVKYVGEGEVKGLKVYKYRQTIEPIKSGTIDVPGDLVGQTAATVTADQIYSSVTNYSIEPVTGVVIWGQTAQDNYLELDGERVLTTTKATLSYTDANVTKNVDDYKSKAMLLTAVNTWIPIGGAILGILLIAVGIFARRDRSTDGTRRSDSKDLVGAR
ncbi:DUF3068 domain-containing protein [Aeromicrobium wangtongii]|uniref:DUF3068 domain-containing protein n=1 Tax=Aeromicrobium wangtongii TaxID=2969247 RepID=UPI0020179950|nr:DUF3068 domain-containing protein [Aeromicrobium wangtongii]MCL3818533.1 DUF3068 domain-containing protein [Aeromicrobium wangtongii]